MKNKIIIPPLGFLARILDKLMVPIMYVLSGSVSEKPQSTHRWNNIHLSEEEVEHLEPLDMIFQKGFSNAYSRNVCLFHVPIFGGWRNYVVIEPRTEQLVWHVGWITDDTIGISRLSLSGPVRLLIGPGDVMFFGLLPDGTQICIKKIGKGHIGKISPFSQYPLL